MLEFDSILDRKLLLVTGKGGIGKSFVTSLIAQRAASLGRSVLVIQSSGCDQIAPYFSELRSAGDPSPQEKVQRIRFPSGVESMNLTAEDNFREYVVKYLGQKMLYESIFSNKVVKTFVKTIPGFAEVMLLGRLFFTCELSASPRFDHVIFDGYASGHFLSLMTTPDAVINSTLGGPLVKETTRVKEFLSDGKKSGIVFVTCPEDLVVSETLDFLPILQSKAPPPLAAMVVNRIFNLQPSLGADAASKFIKERIGKTEKAMQDLKMGLEALRVQGVDMPVFGIREFPFIEMPLKTEFAADALSGHALATYWK